MNAQSYRRYIEIWERHREEIWRFIQSRLRNSSEQEDILQHLERLFKSMFQEVIGREIDDAFVASLPAGTDPNGENGEYHTFCYDGPIFREAVPFRLGKPFAQSYDIRLDDGSVRTYGYWFADLQAAE